jgi:predicted dehydrogenase
MRIGILGTGFGKQHAAIFSSFPDVEVAGIFGRDEEKTRRVAESLGVPGCTDPGHLIDSGDVDAIDICLPTSLHQEYVIAALKAGKHVFCETPVAYTLEEADAMAQAASSSGKLLQVGLFGRFVSDYKYIHDCIIAGHLGELRTIFANRRTPAMWGNGWDENFVLDLMLHDLDYVTWLLGLPNAVTSRAMGSPQTRWDHAFVSLEYEHTCVLVEGSGIMPMNFPFSTSLRVVGTQGAIDLNWVWGGEAPISEIKLYPQQGEVKIMPAPGYDPYAAECRYFVDSILGQVDPALIGIETACDSLKIALAAKTSLEQNGARISI